jgi:hypothetical protein
VVRVARKRPVAIRCVRWAGDNRNEVEEFIHGYGAFYYSDNQLQLVLYTLEGTMPAPIGSMIIEGVDGEFYACRYDIFLKTYEFID